MAELIPEAIRRRCRQFRYAPNASGWHWLGSWPSDGLHFT